jgi:rare lipoprotein A
MKGRGALFALALAGCVPAASAPEAGAGVHYVVGRPYQAGGVWRYPRERFDDDATGLATTDGRTSGVTADGETVDPRALAAAHPTLQLPAIARVTSLESGYQVLVRINDRGPADPGRLIALSPRAMALLRAADPAALRVRVEVLPAESLQLAASLGGAEAPRLALAVVPVGEVARENLPPLPGAAQAAPRLLAAPAAVARTLPEAGPTVPLRLPETVTRTAPRPTSLYVEIAQFGHGDAASLLQRRLAPLGAVLAVDYAAPADRAYRVRIGPLAGVADADATLARVIAAGATDAHIVAE